AEQAGPLGKLGAFLNAHGRAIYGSRPDPDLPKVETGDASVLPVRVGRARFALVAGVLPAEVRLTGWGGVTGLAMLDGSAITSRRDGHDLVAAMPPAMTRASAGVLEVAA
ncbi:MAG: hypothetical protein ACKOBM_15440, partial [Gammaproteobacteria bacterium]